MWRDWVKLSAEGIHGLQCDGENNGGLWSGKLGFTIANTLWVKRRA